MTNFGFPVVINLSEQERNGFLDLIKDLPEANGWVEGLIREGHSVIFAGADIIRLAEKIKAPRDYSRPSGACQDDENIFQIWVAATTKETAQAQPDVHRGGFVLSPTMITEIERMQGCTSIWEGWIRDRANQGINIRIMCYRDLSYTHDTLHVIMDEVMTVRPRLVQEEHCDETAHFIPYLNWNDDSCSIRKAVLYPNQAAYHDALQQVHSRKIVCFVSFNDEQGHPCTQHIIIPIES